MIIYSRGKFQVHIASQWLYRCKTNLSQVWDWLLFGPFLIHGQLHVAIYWTTEFVEVRILSPYTNIVIIAQYYPYYAVFLSNDLPPPPPPFSHTKKNESWTWSIYFDMMFVQLFAHFVQWFTLFSSMYITLFSFQIITGWVHEVVSYGIS